MKSKKLNFLFQNFTVASLQCFAPIFSYFYNIRAQCLFYNLAGAKRNGATTFLSSYRPVSILLIERTQED